MRAGCEIFDGGTLTDTQLAAITLQPDEHTGWRTHTVEGWRPLLTEGALRAGTHTPVRHVVGPERCGGARRPGRSRSSDRVAPLPRCGMSGR
ncbi:hypothetical protein ACFC0B_38505, partial [Kitasatospora sp. NPDC056184]